MGFLLKVAILDCIGFDLADPSGRAVSVRFAKCLEDETGRIERQYDNNALLCHRVTIHPEDDIEAKLQIECQQLAQMGYEPPTRQMIERVKAHCAVEWRTHEKVVAVIENKPGVVFDGLDAADLKVVN